MRSVLPAPADPAVSPAEPLDRIAVRDNHKLVVLAASDIDWIEANDYYVQLHVGAKSYLLRESMRDLETRLDPKRFVRTHRSAIVAIDRVAELRPTASGDYTVRLRDGTELRLSRGRRAQMRALLRSAR
jgi:two-component system LytT family response regulator